MAETQTVRRRGSGLYTHPNELEVPPGSLLLADNCVIDREWVISKRRGFKRYGTALPGPLAAVFEYLKTLIVYEGDRLWYDSDGSGTWVKWTDNVLPPAPGILIRPLEASGAIFIPTFLGILRNESLTTAMRLAGMPQAIDYEISRINTGGLASFLPIDSAVAYRILWGRKDVNGIIITGTPSHQERMINTIVFSLVTKLAGLVTVTTTLAHGLTTGDTVSIITAADPIGGMPAVLEPGTDKVVTVVDAFTFTYNVTDVANPVVGGSITWGKRYNVRLVFTAPPGIQAGDFYEIYRTNVTVGAGTDPGETYKRVRQEVYASGATITFDDTVPQTQLDLPLYTNDTEEGPAQTNDRPPLARFVAFFKTHTFYGYCQREQEIEITLDNTTGIAGDTITINTPDPHVYTFAAAENQALLQFRLFTISDPETPTLAQVVERTMKSFQKIVNRDPLSKVLVYYSSGSEDAPGKVIIRQKSLNTDTFTVESTATNFTPDLSVTPQVSDADLQENEVCRSKSDQPDHVPRLNRMKIGRKNKNILGMLANRDALFVLKEDGLFSISGESDGGGGFSFLVDEQDPTIVLRGLNTLVGLDNALYAYTSQSGTRMTQGGSSIFSRQVEVDLRLIEVLGRFAAEAFGVAYESDRKFLLSIPGDQVWVYNYLTNAWTRWLLPVTVGHVHSTRDRLYYAHSSEPYLLEERKQLAFDGSDQQDEDLDVTVTGGATTTYDGRTVWQVRVTHTYYQPIAPGWYLSQGLIGAKIVAVEEVTGPTDLMLTVDRLHSMSGFLSVAAVVSKPIPLRVIWTPETAESAGTIKQFSGVQVYNEEHTAKNSRLGFLADNQQSFEYIAQTVARSTVGWGLLRWGTFPWGSSRKGRSTPIRTTVPQAHQRCRALTLLFENVQAREQVNIVEAAIDVRPFGTRSERQPN